MISNEDILRLNSLIAICDAVRIDEYKMCVFGLDKNNKEYKMALSADGDHNRYLKEVQQFLNNKVLGSIGGYPSYLKRWLRFGGLSSKNLQNLLKLANIEALIAVINNKDLPSDILPLIWWCATDTDAQAEIARFLLRRKEVLAHPIKIDIANYLLEFLPFMTEDINALMNTVYLLLTEDLIDEATIIKLWQQGSRKTYFLVPFLERRADSLPTSNIKTLKSQDSSIVYLEKLNSEQGQLFLKTSAHILSKINHEYVLYRTLEALGCYCAHPTVKPQPSIEKLTAHAQQVLAQLSPIIAKDKVYARLLLAGVNEQLVVSEIAKHALSGSGSVIRKKLSFILSPLQNALKVLTN